MKFKTIIAFIVVSAILAFSPVAFCADTYKIGVVGPFSGQMAKTAIELRMGWEYSVAQVNERGGIKLDGTTKKIELVFEDSQFRPEVAVSAANKLLTRDQVNFLVSLYSSSSSMAIMEIMQSYPDVIFMSGMSQSSGINKKIASDKSKYGRCWKFFYTSIQGVDASYGIVESLVASGDLKPEKKSILVIVLEDEYGRTTLSAIKNLYEPKGWKVAAEMVSAGTIDFYPLLSKYRAKQPDVIIDNITSPAMGVALAKQNREQGFKSIHIANYYPVLPEFQEGAGDLADRVIAWAVTVDPKTKMSKEFLEKIYKFHGEKWSGKDNGGEMPFGAAQAQLVLEALKRSGSAKPEAVNNAMAKTDMKFLGWRWVFQAEDHAPKVAADYFTPLGWQVQDGDLVSIWPASMARGKYRRP